MTRKYLVSVLVMTLLMVLAAFAVMHLLPAHYLPVMPLMALYFGIVVAFQHWVFTKAVYSSPKTFVQIFLGTTVGVLFLHLVVMVAYLLTHPQHAKLFTVAFLVGFVVSWVFETVAIVMFIKQSRTNNKK